jgi:hypothetical protein
VVEFSKNVRHRPFVLFGKRLRQRSASIEAKAQQPAAIVFSVHDLEADAPFSRLEAR